MRTLGVVALLALASAFATGGEAPPAEIAVSVHLDRPVGQSSPLLYGCSLPAPGAPGASRLLPELLRNRSFEEAPPGKVLRLPGVPGKARGWQLLLCGPERMLVRRHFGKDDPLVLAGRREWRDYRFSLLARKIDGPGGLRVLFELQDSRNHLRWTLGTSRNGWHVLESVGDGRPRQIGPAVVGRIEAGRCYRIDANLRDKVLTLSLDGRPIHRISCRFRFAGIGLGAADATAEYFDIRVLGPKGWLRFLLNHPTEAKRDGVAGSWEAIRDPRNSVQYKWDMLYPSNSNFSQRIQVNEYVGGDAGICQRGIPVSAGTTYRGRVHLRSVGAAAVVVSLRSREGKVHAQRELGDIPKTWTAYDFALTPKVSDPAADLCLSLNQKAILWVDQVSLASSSAIGPQGLRRDFVDALRRLRPTAVRWPSGLAATQYNWRRGVGPRPERPVTTVRGGTRSVFEAAPNDFGTDEFLGLCRELGAEPILVLNARLGVRPALDWLEYCNGEATTPMGKLRAANGRKKPYGVNYWLIHDEPWGEMRAKSYVNTVAKLAEAMREQDPSVKVLAFGGPSMAHGRWEAELVAQAGKHLSHIAKSARLGFAAAEGITPLDQLGAALKSLRTLSLRVALTDWAPGGPPSRSPLAAATALNILAREAGPDAIATCGHAAPLVAIGPTKIDTSPCYEVLKLFRAHSVRRLVRVETRPAAKAQGAKPTPPQLDVLAGRQGDKVVVRLVHQGKRKLKAGLAIEGLGARSLARQADLFCIRDDPRAAAVRTEHERIGVSGGKLSVSLRPEAVHVVVLRVEGE